MNNIVVFYNKGSDHQYQIEWEKELNKTYKNFKLVSIDHKEAVEATVALLWKPSIEKIKKLKKISSIISLGQGVDHIINYPDFPKHIDVYRIVDSYMAKSMSHWVILSILHYIRDFEGYRNQQKEKIYKAREIIDFQSLSIAIYGTGEIGTVVAEDLCRLGFNVNGWSRAKKNNKFFRSFHGIQGFLDLNKNSDIHISLLPLTKETEGIFNKTFFSNVKKNSCFINAGRGDQVIEEDLLWACSENKVKIAILDVYRNEPLPIDHPFWENSKIIIWPHVSAETNHKTSAAQVAKAIKLIHQKKIPKNKINLDLGY